MNELIFEKLANSTPSCHNSRTKINSGKSKKAILTVYLVVRNLCSWQNARA